MKSLSLWMMSGMALVMWAGCAQTSAPKVIPEGCWLDETGVQALELIRIDSTRAKIQSAQGVVEGVLSGNTWSAPTPPPLEETIRMTFIADTAIYELLGTQQRFYRVTGEQSTLLCPENPVIAAEPIEETAADSTKPVEAVPDLSAP